MISVKDHLGNIINLPTPPSNIVSLVPSQTELLADLGLDDRVSAITKFCVHPASWRNTKAIIGGTKQLKLEKIAALNPHLIIANKEENVADQVEWLSARFPVFVTDVDSMKSALIMIKDIGQLTGTEHAASTILSDIRSAFPAFTPADVRQAIPVIYLIWKDPYMTVGGDTFISDMLQYCGCVNAWEDRRRYPEITIPEINQSVAKVVMLSSEPFPFADQHANALAAQLPGTTVICVDGEMFSWYGSRMRLAGPYFEGLKDC